MKRLLACLLIAVILMMAFVACDNNDVTESNTNVSDEKQNDSLSDSRKNSVSKATSENSQSESVCNHTGGVATCINKALCTKCLNEYGEWEPNNHEGSLDWIKTAEEHSKEYTCCETVVEATAKHEWTNGVCTVCEYQCSHQWSDGVCTVCEYQCSHQWSDGACGICGDFKYSEGLEILVLADGECWFSGIGACIDTEIFIPPTYKGLPVTMISGLSFLGCNHVTKVTIPEGVTYISGEAFNNCRNLKSITIPSSVTYIGVWAFYNCFDLTTIYFKGTSEQWDRIEKASNWTNTTVNVEFEAE